MALQGGSYKNLPYDDVVFIKQYEKLPDTFLSNIINSGAVQLDPNMGNLISEGSNTFRMRYLNHLKDTDYQNYDADTDVEFEEIDGGDYYATCYTRMKGWSTRDYVDEFTKTESMRHVLSEIGMYKTKQRQKLFLGILGAVMDSTAKSEYVAGWKAHKFDVSNSENNAPEPQHLFNATIIPKAIQKACGDNSDGFRLVIMHSKVYNDLCSLNLVEFGKYTNPNGVTESNDIPTINGYRIIVNDSVPVDTTTTSNAPKYTTYVLGEGVFKYGVGRVKMPIEFERQAAVKGGTNRVIIRLREAFVPVGFNYKGEDQIDTNNSKTNQVAVPNDKLTSKDSYELFVDPKTIKMVEIVTN